MNQAQAVNAAGTNKATVERTHRDRATWEELVAQYRSSGLSARAFGPVRPGSGPLDSSAIGGVRTESAVLEKYRGRCSRRIIQRVSDLIPSNCRLLCSRTIRVH